MADPKNFPGDYITEGKVVGTAGKPDLDTDDMILVTDEAGNNWALPASFLLQYKLDSQAASAAASGFADVAAAQAAAASGSAGAANDLRRELSVVQLIGPASVIDGPLTAGSATYTFAKPIAVTGKGLRLKYFGKGTGTGYVQIVSRSGTTNTVVSEIAFAITPGAHTVDFPTLEYTAGQFCGYNAGKDLIALADEGGAGFGGYWSGAGHVAPGSSYVDASAGNLDFRMSFELSELAVTDDVVAAIQAQLGKRTDEPLRVGLPVATAPVTGSGLGVDTYVFSTPATATMLLASVSGFSLVAGTYAMRRFTKAGTSFTRVGEDVILTVPTTGVFSVDDVPKLALNAGEYFGIKKLTGSFSLTADSTTPTPYYRGNEAGTSFTAAGTLNTLRFNFGASFVPDTVEGRLALVEAKTAEEPEPAPTVNLLPHATEVFHLVWMLGESHMAGRATTYSSQIPVGRGYCFRRATASIAHLVDPTGNDPQSSGGRGSYGPPIGQTMLDETHGAVGAMIVNSGYGGSRVSQWIDTGAAWVQAKADIDAALPAIKAAKIPIAGVTIAIHIGNNDAAVGTTKALYKTRLTQMINDSRAYLNAGANVPVLLISTSQQANGDYASFITEYQAAQTELTRELANVFIASTVPKYIAERGWYLEAGTAGLHYIQPANDAIGAGIAVAALAFGTGRYPVALD